MVSGLVDQLQADVLNSTVPVSILLRKVKVAAVKLGLDEALAWVEEELNGYQGDDIPAYRKVHGVTSGMDFYQRWSPIHIGDPDLADKVSECWLREPIGNFEAILAQPAKGDISMALDAALVDRLNEVFGWQLARVQNAIPRGILTGIVDRVRTMVLDWALELERNGVRGDGMSFSPEERAKASEAHIHIGEFHGSFNTGDAIGSNSRINQSSTDSSVNSSGDKAIFKQIEQAVRANVADPAARDAILDASNALRIAPTVADRLTAYQRLITAAADHITVLTPFIPALTALLTG